jgi:hypothetical protein
MIGTNTFLPGMLSPNQVDSQNLGVTGTTGNIAVLPGQTLRLLNTHATGIVYINFGNLISVAAVIATDIAILAGKELYVIVPNNCFFMAAIGSTTITLVITKGA